MTQETFRIIISIVIVVCPILFFIYKARVHKDYVQMAQFELNAKIQVDETIPALLESIIEDTFNEFLLMYPQFQDEIYINTEIENEMLKLYSKMVNARLSNTVIDKLSLYYDKNAIPQMVVNKIRLVLVAYAANHNMIKE